MSKITAYALIEGKVTAAVAEINDYISHGWEPYGDPRVIIVNGQVRYIVQCVVKREELLDV